MIFFVTALIVTIFVIEALDRWLSAPYEVKDLPASPAKLLGLTDAEVTSAMVELDREFPSALAVKSVAQPERPKCPSRVDSHVRIGSEVCRIVEIDSCSGLVLVRPIKFYEAEKWVTREQVEAHIT